MLTKYQKCIFLPSILIFTDTAEVLDFYARWSGCDIYIFTITAEILARSLANFHCQ